MSASREWRLRQLIEQFVAYPEQSRFLQNVEAGRGPDRFLKGQFPLAHASDVLAERVRRPLGNANRSEDLLSIVQEHLHLVERLLIARHWAEMLVDPNCLPELL